MFCERLPKARPNSIIRQGLAHVSVWIWALCGPSWWDLAIAPGLPFYQKEPNSKGNSRYLLNSQKWLQKLGSILNNSQGLPMLPF